MNVAERRAGSAIEHLERIQAALPEAWELLCETH
jgi:hypothetical protein